MCILHYQIPAMQKLAYRNRASSGVISHKLLSPGRPQHPQDGPRRGRWEAREDVTQRAIYFTNSGLRSWVEGETSSVSAIFQSREATHPPLPCRDSYDSLWRVTGEEPVPGRAWRWSGVLGITALGVLCSTPKTTNSPFCTLELDPSFSR